MHRYCTVSSNTRRGFNTPVAHRTCILHRLLVRKHRVRVLQLRSVPVRTFAERKAFVLQLPFLVRCFVHSGTIIGSNRIATSLRNTSQTREEAGMGNGKGHRKGPGRGADCGGGSGARSAVRTLKWLKCCQDEAVQYGTRTLYSLVWVQTLPPLSARQQQQGHRPHPLCVPERERERERAHEREREREGEGERERARNREMSVCHMMGDGGV